MWNCVVRSPLGEVWLAEACRIILANSSIYYKTNDCDSIIWSNSIWSFDASSKFSLQAMYKTICFRGIQPVFTHVVWNLNVLPRIHIFVWLLSNNDTLTRTNLAKWKNPDDQPCLFYSEKKTMQHLFFEFCVATVMWKHISENFRIPTCAARLCSSLWE